MRKLLTRWAKLEPDRCEKSSKKPLFTIRANEDEKNILDSDELSGLELAWIQWAVQAAIVERGWAFELKYNPDCPDPRNPYDATVDSSTSGGWGVGSDNLARPLLDAYLYTLEGK